MRQASEGLRLHTARPRAPHGQQLSQEKVAGGAIGHGDTVVIATSNVAVGVRPQQEGRSLGADSMVHYGGSQDFFFPEEGSKNSQK